jgi:hypothetical protein
MSYSQIFKVIPVQGQQLTRDPQTGKKLVDGRPFQVNSWDHSPVDTPIMLVDAGSSNVVGVDFDTDHYFNLAIRIDPSCPYIAKGVGKGGGHFIYNSSNLDYIKEHIDNPNGYNIPGLDLQMGRKLLLLATPANQTKELLTPELSSYDELTAMPLAMQALLVSIYQSHQLSLVATTSKSEPGIHADSKLHYIVKEALEDTSVYHHKLFSVITTKRYKGIMGANTKHPAYPYIPDNLPHDESGNQYLVSVATILGRDPSIDVDMFTATMHYVNSLFSEPYPTDKLNNIISYITSGKSKIDGKAVWQYNPDWNKLGMIYTDNFGQSHEVFAFADKGAVKYLDHNHITNELTELNTAGAVIDHIRITSKRNSSMTKDRLMDRAQPVSIVSTPLKSFGATQSDSNTEFNTYLRNDEQEILMDHTIHSTNYRRPDVTLRFLENSLGYDRCHKFFLPFIKRKFTTYEFSPLVIVLWGPPHSGKSAITNGILRPFSKGRNITLSPEVAIEKYDDWKIGKDVVLVDEAHNTRADILQKMVQTINSISGTSVLSGIRAMQQSASSTEYPNTITIFVTCNKVVTLSSEAQDRRLVICRSNKTAAEALGMSNNSIYNSINRESKDFAYYLATEVNVLPTAQYLSNDWLKDEVYNRFQGGALPFHIGLTTAISNEDFPRFCDLLSDKGIQEEDIAHASALVWGRLHVRLHNTHEHKASSPSILTDANTDIKTLMAELKEIEAAKVKGYDTTNGIKNGNRKTVAVFPIHVVPKEFLERISSVVAMEPLDDDNTKELEID